MKNELHITALKNLIAQGKAIDYFACKDIAKIDNEYQAEAAKYPSASETLHFTKEYHITALENLIAQKKHLDYRDYQNIAKIDNHCQSDAIEADNSLYSVSDMKCAAVMVDHSDF